jgi:hypothetical protein
MWNQCAEQLTQTQHFPCNSHQSTASEAMITVASSVFKRMMEQETPSAASENAGEFMHTDSRTAIKKGMHLFTTSSFCEQ